MVKNRIDDELKNLEQAIAGTCPCVQAIPKVHDGDGGAYILASNIPVRERPYVAAMNFGGQCPVPASLQPGEHAYYAHDYMRWHDWRTAQGDDWQKNAKNEWWYDFISMLKEE